MWLRLSKVETAASNLPGALEGGGVGHMELGGGHVARASAIISRRRVDAGDAEAARGRAGRAR